LRVLLFTGKGGAGTTTTAAATAVQAARSGRSTLVLSTEAAPSLSAVLGTPLTPGVARAVLPGLRAEQVDTAGRVERSWARMPASLSNLLTALDVDAAEAGALAGLPGGEDLAALLTLRDRVRAGASDGTDVVVVDCAPSAQTLRMLALPELLDRLVDRLLPAHRRVVHQVVRGLAPALGPAPRLPASDAEVVQALLRLRADLADVQDVLHAPGTSVRLVLTPESVALAESRRTLSLLSLHGYPVDAVVVNRLVPGGADRWRGSWASAQRTVLDEARSAFAPLPVLTAPYLDREPVGTEALAVLGAELLGGSDVPSPPAGPRSTVRVEPSGEAFELVLDLGLAPGEPPRLSRLDDDLVVAVAGGRRVLPLPSVLRRCVVSGARVRQGAVRVRFERDPDLWPAT
jgi:arsenite-transporting ATPase